MYIILSLLSGIIAIFSPSVVVMLMISMIVLSKIITGEKDGKYMPILFCAFIIIFYLLFILLIAQNQFGYTSHVLSYITLGLLFIIGVYITGIARLLFPVKNLNNPSKFGLLFLMSFMFFSISIDATSPILGTLLVKGNSGSASYFIVSSMVCFAIGLIIPVYLWLLFWIKHVDAFTTKGWWKYVELISGSGLILVSMIEFYLI